MSKRIPRLERWLLTFALHHPYVPSSSKTIFINESPVKWFEGQGKLGNNVVVLFAMEVTPES